MDDTAKSSVSRVGLLARYPLTFYFVFAYGTTWLLCALVLLSRQGTGLLPYDSPLSFMAAVSIGTFVGPALAAFLMSWVCEGTPAIRDLLRRIVLWRVDLRWYAFVLVGIPAIMTLGSIVLIQSQSEIKLMGFSEALHAYFPFFIYPALLIGGPLGEEIGWRGFALPRLQQRVGPLRGSLILGPLWSLWHLPIWLSGQWTQPTLLNIALFTLWISAMTFIMTWIHNGTRGSVLMAILAHASMDAFPNAILWAVLPSMATMNALGYLNGYLGLLIGLGATALVLILLTRGRLGAVPATGH